jgi:hypothetical protein
MLSRTGFPCLCFISGSASQHVSSEGFEPLLYCTELSGTTPSVDRVGETGVRGTSGNQMVKWVPVRAPNELHGGR